MKKVFNDKVIFHVDLDAFYASVEEVDYPQFKGKPVIIGALPGHRGVVSACSYKAREYGIHSAMPISEAYRRCKDGIFLPVRMKRYQEVSSNLMKLFESFTPDFQQISIDEASLNLTGTERLFGPPSSIAYEIKKKILLETGLTISIGIAYNKYLAKLASEYSKPDGLHIIKKGEEIEFLDKLELKDLWGLGSKTLERLEDLNIKSIRELRNIQENSLKTIFGKAAAGYIFKIVRGIDPGVYRQEPKSKSISSEVTFERDTKDFEGIKNVLLDISHQIMFRILESKSKTKTVFIKLRYCDFTTFTSQKTLRHFVSSAEEIHAVSLELLKTRWDRTRLIRLIGLGVSSMEKPDMPDQKELFEDKYDRKKKVEEVVFRIRNNGNPVLKASLLNKKKKS